MAGCGDDWVAFDDWDGVDWVASNPDFGGLLGLHLLFWIVQLELDYTPTKPL